MDTIRRMTKVLIPVLLFIFSIALSLLVAHFLVLFFFIGALINIYVNRRKKSETDDSSMFKDDALLIRCSYALMAPSFIAVAVILASMLGIKL